MPELTVMHFGLLVAMLILGVIIGWIVRADRCAREKIAVNASWQDQLESQQSEHNRLAEQNKSLMEQISQYQASHKDYSNRAKELSDSLKEAFARRDELQRQLKDMRGKLEVAVAQRNAAREELKRVPQDQAAMKEKDDKIFHLSRELTSWQSRVPPLVARFQQRDREARELLQELEVARGRLQSLEELARSDQTRIEPVDAESLPDGGDASNEPNATTSAHDTSELQDQVDGGLQEIDDLDDQVVGSFDEINDLEDQVEPVDDDIQPVAGDEAFDAIFSAETDERDAGEAGNVIEPGAAAGHLDAVDDWDDDPNDGTDNDEDFGSVFAGDGTGGVHAVLRVASDDRDDLQQIKGIGPAIEKTLNELGVTRYHQIAEMSEYEIDRVAQQLKGFRSRIYREDWIGQARDLHYQKNDGRS